MARDLSTTINICSGSFGRVRLTTKSGAAFDGLAIRWEYGPKLLLVEPIGFEVAFGEFVPELLRVPLNQLADAGRVEDPGAVPDLVKLRKALQWPTELAPKSSAASIKRAEQALAAASAAGDAAAAVQQAIDSGATKGLAAVVARLDADARKRLITSATETGAGGVLRVLLVGLAADDIDSTWLLARAAALGKVHSIEALLAAGADVHGVVTHSWDKPRFTNVKYAQGAEHSVLHWAVANGQRGAVRQLLAAGARVTDGAGLAWAAAESPDDGIWRLLLAAGLNVDQRDFRGDPLLLTLGRTGCTNMLEAAIAAGANVNARYEDGSTLLLHAIALAMHKGPDTAFVQNLLRAGADANAGHLYGRNPLALALVMPYDAWAYSGERRFPGWLESAGAVAAEDAGAPAIAAEQPPPPPAWRARIDDTLVRADHYEALGVRFRPSSVESKVTQLRAPGPEWGGLGSDTIAVARAKLEFLIGPPLARGDEYKITFEYALIATVDDLSLALHVCDWKAREICLDIEAHADATLRDRVAAAFWELLTISPLAAFRDRFRFDEYAGKAYHCDGRTAFAEF